MAEDAEAILPDRGAEGLAAALAVRPARARRKSSARPSPQDAFLAAETRKLELELHHLKLGHFDKLLTVGLKLLTVTLGLAIAVVIAAMAWSAHEDHGVAIEAFSVPPDLAQRGLTGQVVASQLLDKLAALQAKTVTARPASTYANDWGGDIKVEIPETGVSIGELNRYLREWLGAQTRITGDVVRTPAGVAVTARAGALAGRTFQGAESDLDQLIQRAAESVYAQTQPYRWAVYLASNGRDQEALRSYAWLADHGSPEDRAWANGAWGTMLYLGADMRGAQARARRAVELDPQIIPAYPILNNTLGSIGHFEEMLAGYRAQLRVLESGRAEGASPESIPLFITMLRGALIPRLLGDFSRAAATDRRMPAAIDVEGSGSALSWKEELVADLAQLHDVTSAGDVAKAGGDDPYLGASLAISRAQEDWAAHLRTLNKRDPRLASIPDEQADRANTLARLGRLDDAQALIDSTPLDCETCLSARGAISALAGDRKAADHWFAEAARRAPSIPLFPEWWGESLLRLGDADGAIARAREAHGRGPRWADPLTLWGEALMQKGDMAGAAAKFAEADKHAPNWGRNHLRWGEALMLSGRYAAARRQFEIASGLDLSKPDRAALNLLLARTASGPLHG